MRYANNEDKNEMQDLMLYIKYLSGIKITFQKLQ